MDFEDIRKALHYMRTHGFWSCDLFIKPDALKQMMRNEAIKWGEHWEKTTKPWENVIGPMESEYYRLMMSGEPVGYIYGCSVNDMPERTDNNADAILSAKDKPYYVIVGKEEELGIFQGWLVP